LVDSGEYEYVLVADITDFYNQASQHRIENALELAGISTARAKNIERFLSSVAAKQSRGLPVGPAASIILAEACLNDVDSFLMRRGLRHTRYVDDFRIFCSSRGEALQVLHDLTCYLYTSHRLALNAGKTRILPVEEFREEELLDPEEEVERGRMDQLLLLVQEILAEFGGYGAFEELDEDAVNELVDDARQIGALRDSLVVMFSDCLSTNPLHLGIARHLLRRATQLRTNVLTRMVFDNLAKLGPVFRDVAIYLCATKSASVERGDTLVDFLLNSDCGKLPFCRLWGVEILNRIVGIVSSELAWQVAEQSPGGGDFRSLALVATSHKCVDWVREQKESWSHHGPWDKRGIVWASQVLPRDERGPWLSVVEGTGDLLDKAVAQYVRGIT